MIKYTVRILALGVCLLLLANVSVMAGGANRAGTASGTQLLLPVGARYLAMGGANVAAVEGIEAVHWNPAGLSRSANAAELMFSHMSYFADMSVEYVGVSNKFGDLGSFGFSVKALSIGEIPETTIQNPDGTGANFSPTFFTLGVTYSKLLTDRISIGVNAKLFSEQIPRAGASGIAFDAGVQYSGLGGFKGLSIGVVIKNLGPEVKWDGSALGRTASDPNAKRPTAQYKIDAAPFELPTHIEMGISYAYQINDANVLNTSFNFQNNNYYDDETKIGAEYSFNNMVFLRGGYSMAPNATESYEYIWGPTFGAGLHQKFGNLDMNLDYTYRTVSVFESNHVFALRLGF